MTRYLNRARPLAGALAFVMGLALVAPPALIAEAPEPATTAERSLAQAVAAKVEAMPPAALAQAAQVEPATAAPGDKPFLKSRKGVVAAVLMGSVLGYMAYSFSSDRVKSPAK